MRPYRKIHSTNRPRPAIGARGNGPGRKQDAHDDLPVPDVDPFYAATLRARAADEAEAESRERPNRTAIAG